MEELELFILRIPKFKEKTAAELIDYFAYFLLHRCSSSNPKSTIVYAVFEEDINFLAFFPPSLLAVR